LYINSKYLITLVYLSVDDRYRAEKIFQIYWFTVNNIALLCIWLHDRVPNLLGPLTFKESVLIAAMLSGVLSFAVFFVQRGRAALDDDNDNNEDEHEDNLFEKALRMDRVQSTRKEKQRKYIIGVVNVSLSWADYWTRILTFLEFWKSGDNIWASVTLLIPFLPGLEWYNNRQLVGPQHRLHWFLASLFFPFFVVGSRVSKFVNW
jgi:hypothetical protein